MRTISVGEQNQLIQHRSIASFRVTGLDADNRLRIVSTVVRNA